VCTVVCNLCNAQGDCGTFLRLRVSYTTWHRPALSTDAIVDDAAVDDAVVDAAAAAAAAAAVAISVDGFVHTRI
jgi:hypothetical protein